MVEREWKKEYRGHENLSDKARPFFIEAQPNNENIAILVHGFTSSPYTMRHLAYFLAEKGVDVEVLLLAGHGGDFNKLKKINHDTWEEEVEEVLLEKFKKYKNVYFIGHSFGANIGLCLAAKYPQLKGFVSLGISIFLTREKTSRLLLPLANIFRKRWKKRWVPAEKHEQFKEAGRFLYIPIPSIVQFYRFIDQHTKKKVGRVKVPALIVHSRYDEVSKPRSSEYLFKNIASEDKELFILDKNNHGLLHKTRRDFLFAKIADFIYKHS